MDHQQLILSTSQPDTVEQINFIASSDEHVLLFGPRDSGKEWVAELIHDLSGRNERPFLIISCVSSATYNILVELSYPIRRELGELMKLREEGLLESVSGGTVWLNNLTELPLYEQKKLIDRITDQLGCRVITGVSKPAGARAANDQSAELFSEKVTLNLPPLRNHRKNIQFFINYFLAKTNLEWNRTVPGFTEEAAELLVSYAWPGNLTELRDTIREAVFLGKNGEAVPAGILPQSVRNYQSQDPLFLKKAVLKAEYDLICKTLYETRNNKRKAAEILKISRKTLYSKMRIFQDVNRQGSAA
ncbi:MAG: sigma 54-interacting transcriptional regulator [Chitinophagaceae bacterium]